MRVIKCDICKREIPADNRQNRITYHISYLGRYLDLCDNCYDELVLFINNGKEKTKEL